MSSRVCGRARATPRLSRRGLPERRPPGPLLQARLEQACKRAGVLRPPLAILIQANHDDRASSASRPGQSS